MLPHSEVPDASGKITAQCLGISMENPIENGGSMGVAPLKIWTPPGNLRTFVFDMSYF
jgi:hypothetical protein